MNDLISQMRETMVENKKFCDGCYSRDLVTTITVKEHLNRGWIFTNGIPEVKYDLNEKTTAEGVTIEERSHFIDRPCHFCNKTGRLSLSSVMARMYQQSVGQGFSEFILQKDGSFVEGEWVESKYNALNPVDLKGLNAGEEVLQYFKEVS